VCVCVPNLARWRDWGKVHDPSFGGIESGGAAAAGAVVVVVVVVDLRLFPGALLRLAAACSAVVSSLAVLTPRFGQQGETHFGMTGSRPSQILYPSNFCTMGVGEGKAWDDDNREYEKGTHARKF
jgi:hypothetical protein